MKTIYAREQVDKSIFLAGPTPREAVTPSWRPQALSILHDLKFDGTVYVPEDRTSNSCHEFEYDAQINWELTALHSSSIIVFWVPRDLTNMPAFTTNVEFGHFISTGKCMFGAPKDAPKNDYLRFLARRYGVSVFDDLEELLSRAVHQLNRPYGPMTN